MNVEDFLRGVNSSAHGGLPQQMDIDEVIALAEDEAKEEFVTSLTPSGIAVYYSWAPRRYYQVRASVAAEMANEHLMWREVPSVTSVLGVLDRPALPWWGMKVGVEGVLKLYDDKHLAAEWNGYGNPWLRLNPEEPISTKAATVDEIVSLLTEHKLTVNHVKDSAAKRGVNVHTVFEKWSVDQSYRPILDTYPETEQGYIRGLVKFLDDICGVSQETSIGTVLGGIEAEVMVGSIAHGFAGRYDLRLTLDKDTEVVTRAYPKRAAKRETVEAGKLLIDLKTSKKCYPTHALQLAAYELASIECGYGPTNYRYVLHVTADGQYEFVKCNATAEDFLSILQAHNTMQRKDWF